MAAQRALDQTLSAVAANLVSDGARASAVALAGCCKSFEDPALTEVWRRLDSLAPLVKCFPHEIWELKDEVLMLKRAPLDIQWTRFQRRYWSKVRLLDVSVPSTVDPTTLQMFQICSHYRPLLPNLLHLNWRRNGTILPFITLFFSKSLTSITVHLLDSPPNILSRVLTMLPTMAPNISKIEVYPQVSEPSMEEASSQLLTRCTRLRSYDIQTPLSALAFSLAMRHPLLDTLRLEAPIRLPVSLPDVIFPILRILMIRSDEDFGWLKLLPKSPSLSAILVECPGRLVEQFIEVFQLTIAHCDILDRFNIFSVQSPHNFKITRMMIACNLSLKNLKVLNLYSSCCDDHCQTSNITDQDIDLLTSSIPGLNSLTIGSGPCSIPSKITFNSLYTISSRCTQLKSLRIHFNPTLFISTINRSEPKSNRFENRSPVLCSVQSINAGRIPLPGYPNVCNIMAFGLLEVFPCLETVRSGDTAWQEIQTQLRVIRSIRNSFVGV